MAINDILGSMTSRFPGAVSSLGLGDQLSDQVRDETEEERKRRLRLMQPLSGLLQRGSVGADRGPGAAFGGLAASQLFGSYGR